MADCENIQGCLFFNNKLSNMPVLANIMKEQYCYKDYSKCARFIVSNALGKGKVPEDLYPAMFGRANQIVGKH